ncbi:MAG: ABC transporter substrate-binding protein [Actinomycetota bacterium]
MSPVAAAVVVASIALAACSDGGATDGSTSVVESASTADSSAAQPATTSRPQESEATTAPVSTVSDDAAEAEPVLDEEARGEVSTFPVTIEHGLGETIIESRPERVVALGAPEADALIALGITPTAAPSNPTAPDGQYVWWDDALGSSTTLLVSDFSGAFNVEEVAALEPDVILAATSAVDDGTYALYSEIAPTIPFLTAPFQDSWQTVTTMVGEAVGLPDEADELIVDTSATVEQLRTLAPGIDGATYTFNVVPAPGTLISVTEPADVANQFFSDLGLDIAPGVADLPRQPGTGATISSEQLELIDADVVMMFYVSEAAAVATREQPTFAATTAASEGRVIELTGDQAVAVRVPSVLAVPWLLESIGPQLMAALS